MILLYCSISPVLVLLEEILLAKRSYRITKQIGNIIDKNLQSASNNKHNKPNYNWEKLSEEEKCNMIEYYNFKEKSIDFRAKVMSRESSIQLVYQTAFVFYQFFNNPVRELDFSSRFKIFFRTASSVWIMGLTFQIISIILSAFSTFSPILENLRFKSLVLKQKEPYVGFWIVKIIQIVLHIFFSSGVIYLFRVLTNNR